MKFTGKPLRWLDFDVECRPLSYLGQDFTTGQITAIAAAWIVDGKPVDLDVRVLNKRESSYKKMLEWFVGLYHEADGVTGHYIRGFDLPVINGALLDLHMEPLSDKLTHDTKSDLLRRKYMSVSQENLGALFGLDNPKVQMNTPKWREANKLTPEGLDLTAERVVGDVVQHIELREALLEAGWLGAPKIWRSSGVNSPRYVG